MTDISFLSKNYDAFLPSELVEINKTFIKSLVFTIILILRKKYFDKDFASYKKKKSLCLDII